MSPRSWLTRFTIHDSRTIHNSFEIVHELQHASSSQSRPTKLIRATPPPLAIFCPSFPFPTSWPPIQPCFAQFYHHLCFSVAVSSSFHLPHTLGTSSHPLVSSSSNLTHPQTCPKPLVSRSTRLLTRAKPRSGAPTGPLIACSNVLLMASTQWPTSSSRPRNVSVGLSRQPAYLVPNRACSDSAH